MTTKPNEKSTTKVAMKVNQANLINGLKFSFTHKTTVLGELMQNARRAKASQVNFFYCAETKALQVSDDGCGIDSIETLLSVAESGWAPSVVAQEHPFGLGFLSALFACRKISVISKSGYMMVETEKVLAFKPVTIKPVKNWQGITIITLHDIELSADKIHSTLKRLARGFPIPVIFNGVALPRPAAIKTDQTFEDTEFGQVYLHGLENPIDAQYEFDLFLQGLPIYSSHSYSTERHIIHLNSAKFHARLPDRDKLVDEADVIQQVNVLLAIEIEKRLKTMKAAIPAEAFIQYFKMMQHWNLLHLLNDVPLVPVQALSEITSYPVCDTEIYEAFATPIENPLTRTEIEKRGVVNIEDDIHLNGAARYLYAREKDYLIYNGNLDSGHWLQPLVRNLNDEPLTIELVNESHTAQFQGSWCWVNVRFCDRYKIKLGHDMVEITEDGCYQVNDHAEEVIVPKGDSSAQVLCQASSYRNEYDEYQEILYETDQEAFSAFVVANTTKDPADALKRLMPGFYGCPSVYGKSFSVSIDDKGAVESVTVITQ